MAVAEQVISVFCGVKGVDDIELKYANFEAKIIEKCKSKNRNYRVNTSSVN